MKNFLFKNCIMPLWRTNSSYLWGYDHIQLINTAKRPPILRITTGRRWTSAKKPKGQVSREVHNCYFVAVPGAYIKEDSHDDCTSARQQIFCWAWTRKQFFLHFWNFLYNWTQIEKLFPSNFDSVAIFLAWFSKSYCQRKPSY